MHLRRLLSSSVNRHFGLPVGSRVAVGLIPALLLVTPLVVLLRHHGYSLTRPEVPLSLLFFVWPGLVSALCFRYRWMSGLITMIAAAVFAGTRLESLGSVGVFIFAIAGFGSVCSVAFQRVTLLMVTTMFLSSLVLPAGERTAPPRVQAAAGSTAPFVLQIIFDEHIGLQGLQAAVEEAGALGEEIRRFFGDRGFALFEGAYSEYFMTNWSLPHVLNFTPGRFEPGYLAAGDVTGTYRVTRNRLFESLLARGYSLRVFQSDYLDVCVTPGNVECSTYSITDLGVLQSLPISTAGRAWVIVTAYLGTSTHYLLVRELYDRATYHLNARGIRLPEWTWDHDRVSPLSSMMMARQIEQELRHAGPGHALLAHLMMPHYPYALDEHCHVRPVADWDEHMAFRRPDANTAASRSRRYTAYVSQVRCVYSLLARLLDAVPEPVRADSVVLVYGDHGSRIVTTNPDVGDGPVSGADLVDGYSTLFAIRSPRVGSGSKDLVPLTCLVKAALADEGPFQDAVTACRGIPQVYRSGIHKFEPYRGAPRRPEVLGP